MNDETKLSRFVEEIRDLAKEHGITMLYWTAPQIINGYVQTNLELGIHKNTPPDLGVHIQDGIGSKDKVGG